jgi:PAS domain-containing protein
MTPALVFAASALILGAGWALIRTYEKGKAVAVQTSEDRVLMDLSPIGILLLDSGLRVEWVNTAFCDLFGLIDRDLIGREFTQVIQDDLKSVVSEPDVVEAGLLAACSSASKGSPFEFYLEGRDNRDERLLEHTCQVVQNPPLEGRRVAYFVDVTPGKRNYATPHGHEIHLRELDSILVKLARRNSRSDADEAALLREVAETVAGACKPDRWELWFLGEDRTRWSLDHLNYTTPRRESKGTPQLSPRQTGPYLRALEQVRVLVKADLKNGPDSDTLLGHGSIEPHGSSRLDIPVRVQGKVAAVLVLVHHTRRPWTSGERRFAASIGDWMSLLLQTARAGESSMGKVDQKPERLPSAASSAVDGFIHLDEKLRFTFLNPAALRWLEDRGMDGNTLIGRGLEESMREVKDRSIVAEVRKATRGGGRRGSAVSWNGVAPGWMST